MKSVGSSATMLIVFMMTLLSGYGFKFGHVKVLGGKPFCIKQMVKATQSGFDRLTYAVKKAELVLVIKDPAKIRKEFLTGLEKITNNKGFGVQLRFNNIVTNTSLITAVEGTPFVLLVNEIAAKNWCVVFGHTDEVISGLALSVAHASEMRAESEERLTAIYAKILKWLRDHREENKLYRTHPIMEVLICKKTHLISTSTTPIEDSKVDEVGDGESGSEDGAEEANS